MVTAGVYMVCRNAVLFTHAPMVMTIVAVVGAATALIAATIGLVQTDIKKVLAYSTVSQLGYMFLATGVGAFGAAAFHLMTHAFFKALLFLGSGSVIHAMNDEQEMTKMGGLRAYMPTTFLTMFIGALAIAGVPGLAGFFSKDEILAYAFRASPVLWVIGVITAAMTAFYMFRLIYLTFYGNYRGPSWEHAENGEHGHGDSHAWHGPHESPRAMTVPLMVLAVGAIAAGYVGIPAVLGDSVGIPNAIEHYLEPSFVAGSAEHAEEVPHLSHAAEFGLMGVSVVSCGWWDPFGSPELRPATGSVRSVGTTVVWGLHKLLTNKYYVDEFYDRTVVAGTMTSARGVVCG